MATPQPGDTITFGDHTQPWYVAFVKAGQVGVIPVTTINAGPDIRVVARTGQLVRDLPSADDD